MKRFDWDEMRRYWEKHNDLRAKVDFAADPDALENVCHSGAPLWLNRYYARFQEMTYEKLFALLPAAKPGARALDVGCGGARWCRFLARHGYQTTGIDLQAALIERNRERYPGIEFVRTSAQEYTPPAKLDLVSSVTVIQHNPFHEQKVVLERIRSWLNPGGYALILENVEDQTAHVFANSIEEWKLKFQAAGFRCIATQHYDYSPFSRAHARLIRELRRAGAAPAAAKPDEYMARRTRRGLLRAANESVLRLAVSADQLVEPLLIRGNVALPTVHCGFLFQAV